MGMAWGDLYAVNAAGHSSQGPAAGNAAPDARDIAPSTPAAAGSPAMSWVALVATLVFIRVLQEMAE